MTTFVAVNTYTYSVTFVANNILMCLQDVVRLSGLDPGKISTSWRTLETGIARWLETKHLETVTLEVFHPSTQGLVGRWDFSIAYGWNGGGGTFWVDTEQIKYAIRKQGVWPSTCDYEVIVHNRPGRPNVDGWGSTSYRATDGFVRQSIGTTMDASGLSAGATYYRKL